jgi:carboxypeptidase PM20D1
MISISLAMRLLMKRSIAVIGMMIVLALGIICWRTIAPAAPVIAQGAPLPPITVDSTGAIARFAAAIRIQTVSVPLQAPNAEAMQRFRDFLLQNFPLVHQSMQREVTAASALLFTWRGSDPTLDPIVLMGHMDVVTIDPTSLSRWEHLPFSGDVADGFLWGRGTMDDKQAVLSYLEAAEALLRDGYRPRRTVYLAFGSDEENDGHGQESIVALLQSRGVHPEFVLDEGGNIARGTIPNVHGDVAILSIAEKGYSSLQLSVNGNGGHSSRPPRHTAIGILARAVTRIEESPMPAYMNGVTEQMLAAVALHMLLPQRAIVRNEWLLRPLLLRTLSETPEGNALIRTTTAVTMFNAGVKDNVLPGRAQAVVNFRILPGDTVKSNMERVGKIIDDARVTVSPYGAQNDPTPISPTDTPGYLALTQTVHDFFPEAVLAPNLLGAHTDSSLYYSLTHTVYRFFPAVRTEADNERIHGVNERLSISGYLRAVQFMATLMRRESMK